MVGPQSRTTAIHNPLRQSALTAISWRKQSNEFSDRRVFNCHFQLNTQSSTCLPKLFEDPADLAQAAKDYGRDTRREQMSYITETGSAGQKACLREEGLSTSNINKAFLDAAKDILKKN
ncbi:hypothetical protein PROFUN_00734 [Planoprotostelium fungivorum]|uniref:Uncharacterized protein n=1 Tax=Planoprotostelium fungivorum TaxID=1890364 RepID=A0A2P6NU76_9EUKA|nr:hypothetical protein PROFUN_00734 [Planoprotostelium fungivorum]